MNNKQRYLKKSMMAIAIFFILLAVIMWCIGIFITMQNEKQIYSSAQSMMEIYGESLDRNFYAISEYVADFLINERSDINLLTMREQPSDNETVTLVNIQKGILDDFNVMNKNYGEDYHIFYYNSTYDLMIQSGSGDTKGKNDFKSYLRHISGNDDFWFPKTHQWTLVQVAAQYCAMTVIERSGVYMGCWISLEKLTDVLLKESKNDTLFFISSEETCVYTVSEDMKDSPMKHSVKYEPQYGDFEIVFVPDRNMGITILMLRILIIMAGVFCAVTAVLITRYMKKSILMPVLYFSRCVENYKKDGTFGGDYIYEEFGDAARLLKSLEADVQNLRIQVYERQLEKQKTELDYAQLISRPHFYINCLNNVYSMIQMNKKTDVQKMIVYISNYLRSTFRKATELITVGEELKNVQNYVDIHRILYRDGCKNEIYIEAHLENALVPPLMIQIFVENSIKYTLDMEKCIEIKIRVFKISKERMVVEIEDNGHGFPITFLEGEEIRHSEDSRFHIGIHNVKERLRLIYKESSDIRLFNTDEGGACVRIELPLVWEV